MKKGKNRILKLAGLAAAGIGAAAVYTAKKENVPVKKVIVENYGEKAATALLSAAASALPDPHWLRMTDYTTHNFYPGHERFIGEAGKDSRWQLGFARTSILPDDYLINKYYIAGYLHYPPNVMSGVEDDQVVRAVCLDDGSGRGSVVFAVIDCVGISNTDIREIRAGLEQFAKANNIVGINISATHCHSAIDTQGLWGDLPEIVANNVKAIKANRPEDLISGRNPKFMKELHQKTEATIKAAVEDMRMGKLYSRRSKNLKYNRDKRPPDVTVRDIVSLRFVPDDGERETVMAFAAAHPVSLGAKNTLLSSDYIYYAEQSVNAANKNFIFFQGAELATATCGDFIPDDEPQDVSFKRYGRAMGKYLASVPSEDEERVAPILNFAANEVFVPCSSEILSLAAKTGIINNRILRTGSGSRDLCFVTEIGYVELGRELCMALVPGELAPSIAEGGVLGATGSYNKTDWKYPAMSKMVKGGRSLTVVCLCNDSIGYIIPDNDFGSIFAPLHYEESVSAGNRTASKLVDAFDTLLISKGRRAGE